MDSEAEVKSDPRRALPPLDTLVRALTSRHPELPGWALREGARGALAEERARLGAALAADPAAAAVDRVALEARAEHRACELARAHPIRVVNATGIALHTNLGRAPLAEAALAAVVRVAQGYSDLEIDLASGSRSSRVDRVARKLCLASGAAGALVVNNNAAALLLVLAALARERDVIVSRGELVEIGGSFRIPEIVEAAGVRLVEVGTTNRTHRSDYERAAGASTALLLKVHRSNFEQRGFVTEVDLPELASVGRELGLPVVEDLGSGTLLDLSAHGFPPEAHAPSRLALGADLVCFSGDKLLGGPQAGILLGTDAACIARIGRHPLSRALRVDKLTLAALDATLDAYLGGRAVWEIPALRQLLEPSEALESRARSLAQNLAAFARGALQIEVIEDCGYAGGGSLPGFALPSWVVALRAPAGAAGLAECLRRATPPVLTRVRDDLVLLDVRTLLDGDEKALEQALRGVLR
jgi:L-seryl-tRNA(Ser) seleniumtransferase